MCRRYRQVSAGRPRGGTWPALLVAVLLLTCLAGVGGPAPASAVQPYAGASSGSSGTVPEEQRGGEEGGSGERVLRGDGESGRGEKPGGHATARGRSAGPFVARPLPFRLLTVIVPNAPPPLPAAHPAPLSGPRAGPARRTPGARLLTGLQISRT
ncbi:hypothetical protein [Actinomadura kijaniata]|uniref:hypothetical protein n=1 Tax=Actinomadura kijaniata TaxID=46161 RepID=UPI0008318A3F|nr:hypothetical protein [Actinomadura kijaniata]